MEIINFKVEGFIVFIENDITGNKVLSRIIYPIRTQGFDCCFDEECSMEDRHDFLVEKMGVNFLFFRNILFNFNYYKQLINHYRIAKLHQVVDLLSQDERDMLINSLATDYFHKNFKSVPTPAIKMDLFVAMLELPTIQRFKAYYAPEKELGSLTISKNIIVHKTANEHYRAELFDFDRQLN